MANAINWGETYCNSWFGDASNEGTLHIDSQPICFV